MTVVLAICAIISVLSLAYFIFGYEVRECLVWTTLPGRLADRRKDVRGRAQRGSLG